MNSFKITTEAAKNILKNILQRGHGVGIHVGVRTTGCSGLAYVLEYQDEYPTGGSANYAVFTFEGANVFVFDRDYPYLDGAELDYVRNGLNQGFKINNPNSRDECGCGESFRV